MMNLKSINKTFSTTEKSILERINIPDLSTFPLHTDSYAFGSTEIQLTTLKDLNQAIDTLFESLNLADHLNETEKASALSLLCPYFGVLWPSALALTKRISLMGGSLRGQRILEVGSGLSLPSLFLAKTFPDASLYCLDNHPLVGDFLVRNGKSNGVEILRSTRHGHRQSSIVKAGVHFIEAPWNAPGMGEYLAPFDWILGSDILYEREHPESLADGLTQFAHKKSRFLIADPGRPYLQDFVQAMKTRGWRCEDSVEEEPLTKKEIFLLGFSRSP